MNTRIIFNDKTEIAVEQNGSCYIVDEKPAFPDDLTNITVVNEEGATTILYARIQECSSIDGRYWFALIPETREERIIRKLIEELIVE